MTDIEEVTGGQGSAEELLLGFLRGPDYRPMPQRELLHRMQVQPEQRPEIRRLIRSLVREGRIHKIGGGRLVAAPSGDGVRGILQRHREGFGFVVPDGGGEDLFVPPRHLGEAVSGDRVAARVTGRRQDGRMHGVITAVLEQRRADVLGLFCKDRGGGLVQPFEASFGAAVRVRAAFAMGAEDQQVVRVSVMRDADPARPREGKVIEVLGELDQPGTDVVVVVRKYGLSMEFPEEVLEAAEALPEKVSRAMAGGRERFDDPAPVTIDGETAQDFDDAVAVSELPRGGFRLYVHIADVAHFVPPGEILDREARQRGTSVYFPGRVLPMFPEALSNGLCSLRPGEDRLVQSVVIDFTAQGKPHKVRFADGVIRSAARLTYTQVASVLEGEKRVPGVPAKLHPMLQAADRLRELLERKRHARGSIDFDLPEPQILLDVEGVMTGITIEPRNRAHRMIEEFMLSANDAVARHLEQHEADCMFRVHDPPDPLKLETLDRFVRGFDLRLDVGDEPIEPGAFQRLLDQAEGRPEYRIIGQMALRTMMQARYSPDNVGHFGLASPSYAHFTSPIRRYPDLVVHRQLRALRGRPARRRIMEPESLRGVAETSSELERNAEAAERELLAWKKIAFIADKVGEKFEGVVTGVARFGLFVQLTENLVEGLIRVEWLGEEWFEFDEGRMQLLGSRTAKRFRLGDRLQVQVDRVDRALQRVDLSLAGRGRGPGGSRPPGKAPAPARAVREAETRDHRKRSRRKHIRRGPPKP